MQIIRFDELKDLIYQIFIKLNVADEKSFTLARIIAESTLDGVNSHGINRLPLLAEYIKQGIVKKEAEPEIILDSGSLKQIDGKFGFGILNAIFATDTVIHSAKQDGIGLAAMRFTNHWHRAGTYGWRAADKGMIFICWTNTIPLVPPYGSKEKIIGNNPFVFAIPRDDGHIVLDMATSQYSVGKIASYARMNKELPEFGGYDADGNLTKNAGEIRHGGRHMPIGLWKGSALTFVLDMVAAVLSGGNSTYRLSREKGIDTGASQIFLAIDPDKFSNGEFRNTITNETIDYFRQIADAENTNIKYPGEETLKRRKHNLENGIPVEKEIFEKVINLKREL